MREVVLLGRRGPEHAAFTRPELLMLPGDVDAEVVIADGPEVPERVRRGRRGDGDALRRLRIESVDLTADPAPGKRLVLAFDTTVEDLGVDERDRLDAVTVRDSGGGERTIPATSLIWAHGWRMAAVNGLPYNDSFGGYAQAQGRLLDETGEPVPGAYLVGWAKRGARGGIGANKLCAEESIATLLEDALAGRLTRPSASRWGLGRLLRRRAPDRIGARAAHRILDAETSRGCGPRPATREVHDHTADALGGAGDGDAGEPAGTAAIGSDPAPAL